MDTFTQTYTNTQPHPTVVYDDNVSTHMHTYNTHAHTHSRYDSTVHTYTHTDTHD